MSNMSGPNGSQQSFRPQTARHKWRLLLPHDLEPINNHQYLCYLIRPGFWRPMLSKLFCSGGRPRCLLKLKFWKNLSFTLVWTKFAEEANVIQGSGHPTGSR